MRWPDQAPASPGHNIPEAPSGSELRACVHLGCEDGVLLPEKVHLGGKYSPRTPAGRPCSSRPRRRRARPVASTDVCQPCLPMPGSQRAQEGSDHSARGHHPHPWVTEGLILEAVERPELPDHRNRGWPVWEGAGKGHTLQAAVCGNVLIRGFLDTVVNLLPTIPH